MSERARDGAERNGAEERARERTRLLFVCMVLKGIGAPRGRGGGRELSGRNLPAVPKGGGEFPHGRERGAGGGEALSASSDSELHLLRVCSIDGKRDERPSGSPERRATERRECRESARERTHMSERAP